MADGYSLPYSLLCGIGILSVVIVFAVVRFISFRNKSNKSSPQSISQASKLSHSSSPNSNYQIKKQPAETVSAISDLSERKDEIAPKVGPARIFVSYRRSDSADIAGRIYDRLIGRFGKDPVFKDVDSIPLGFDFKEYLDKKVGEFDIWGFGGGDSRAHQVKKRLEDPTDFVRIEIESALERGIPVIPLLVRGAEMPSEGTLPSSLRKLVYRNGIPIRSDPDFHRDMDRLISALEKYTR
jgi:hypothetical protein